MSHVPQLLFSRSVLRHGSSHWHKFLVLIIRSSSLPEEILNTLVHLCKRKFVPKTLLLTLKLDGCFFLTTGILKQIYCTLQRFKDWVFAFFRKNIMLKIRTINVKHLVINWRINNMDKLVFQCTVHTVDRVFVNQCMFVHLDQRCYA